MSSQLQKDNVSSNIQRWILLTYEHFDRVDSNYKLQTPQMQSMKTGEDKETLQCPSSAPHTGTGKHFTYMTMFRRSKMNLKSSAIVWACSLFTFSSAAQARPYSSIFNMK